MKEEIKERWIEALTSGQYKQGMGVLGQTDLTDGDVHCCLGVLSELACQDGVIERTRSGGSSRYIYDEHVNYPSNKVLEWAGLPHSGEEGWEAVKVQHRGSPTTLAMLNDQGINFEGIAAIIRDQL